MNISELLRSIRQRTGAKSARLKIGRVVVFAAALAYLAFHFFHTQKTPWAMTIETIAALIVVEVVFRALFDPHGDFVRSINSIVRNALKPVLVALEKLGSSIQRVEKRLCIITTLSQQRPGLGGIQAVHPRMDFRLFIESACEGDIVWFFDTYIPNFEQYLEEIKQAIMRNVTFRFLVIDPECQCAADREKLSFMDRGVRL